jgi:WD40 repeat protein
MSNPLQQHRDWIRLFTGRERELETLRRLLLTCAPTLSTDPNRASCRPSLAVLVGDSGVGKSRLVQEFYRQLACAPTEGGLDPTDYWPDSFADPDQSAKVVNPTLVPGQTTGKVPPFIWWGIRWPEPPSGQAPSQLQLTSPYFLDQLEAHRDGCKRRVERFLKAAGAVTKIASSSLVPGLPDLPFVDLIRQTIDQGASAFDASQAARKAGTALNDWREGYDASRGILRRRETALQRLKAIILGILKPAQLGPFKDASTPLILWLDDAQWMTAEECACLHDLLREAAIRQLPLMVIATHWESAWHHARSRSSSSKESKRGTAQNIFEMVRGLGSELNANRPEPTIGIETLILSGQGSSLDLTPCLAAALPCLELAQRNRILALAGENPLLLRLIIEELLRHPERFEGRDVRSKLTREAEFDLSRIALSEARSTFVGRRIRELDLRVRRVLELGSLQGSEFLRQVTCEAAEQRGIAHEETIHALLQASGEHAILDDAGSTLSFRQDIYRGVLEEALSLPERHAIESAIRKVLVQRLLQAEGSEEGERELLNTLALRFLAIGTENIDWTSRESGLWIQAVLQHLEMLDRNGLDVLALARAREVVAIDARTEGGIPMALMNAPRASFVLRILTRFGTNAEALEFGERLLQRIRQIKSDSTVEQSLELVTQIAELRGSIAEYALYVASLRGAQAALSEGDPLSARLALDTAPTRLRGPEHRMFSRAASRKGALLRGSVGGNPYRIRSLPNASHLIALFDDQLEVIPVHSGASTRLPLRCLLPDCPAMRLDLVATNVTDRFFVAVGSTAYPTASAGPLVHLHVLEIKNGAWELTHLWSMPSGYWGDAIFLSPTLDRVLIPTSSRTLAIVENASGAIVEEFPLPVDCGPVTALARIDASKVALAAGGEILTFDILTGVFEREIHRHPTRVNSLTASPNGAQLCVGGGRHATLVRLADNRITRCRAIEGDVWETCFSPDSSSIAVVGGDCMIRTFDSERGVAQGVRGEASGITWSVVWDSTSIFISAEGGEVIAIDAHGNQKAQYAHESGIIDVDSRTGTRIFEQSLGETYVMTVDPLQYSRLRDASKSSLLRLVPDARQDEIAVLQFDEQRVIAYDARGRHKGESVLPQSLGRHIAIAPAADYALALLGMSAVRLSNITAALAGSGEIQLSTFALPNVAADWFSCLLRDRVQVPLLGRMDGGVYEWSASEPRLLVQTEGWVQAGHQLSDGGWVFGNHNGRIQRAHESTCVWRTDLRRAYVRSIVCCEQSHRCYVLMMNGCIHVLDLDSGSSLCTLGKFESPPNRLVLIADGQYLEAIGSDGRAQTWDAREI